MQPANSALCTMVRALLQTSASNQHIPPAEVVAHIAVCDLCRGALALLATTMFASAPHPLPTSCADCQAVLDAFIDLEHATELIQAMQAYPQAGWHVWICPDCAQTYRLTRAALDAEAQGALAALPLSPIMPHLLTTIRLARAFLNAALPVPIARQPQLRGAEAAERVLYNELIEGHQLRLSMARQPNDQARLTMQTRPALAGGLRLYLGLFNVWVPFNASGQAHVPDLPPTLLDAPDGPDLLVDIEIIPR